MKKPAGLITKSILTLMKALVISVTHIEYWVSVTARIGPLQFCLNELQEYSEFS